MKQKQIKTVKTNNKKIIAELVLIPLCFMYLMYTLLENHPKASFIICSIMIIITCLELALKYLKEVYIYKHKYNLLKIIFGIFNIVLIIVSCLNFIYDIKIIYYVHIIMTIILLMFLLVVVIQKLIYIGKNKGTLYKNAITVFLSLISFTTIFTTLILS